MRDLVDNALGVLSCVALGLCACTTPPRHSTVGGPNATTQAPVAARSASASTTKVETKRYVVERSLLSIGDRQLALHLPEGRPAPVPTVLVFHSAMGRTESVLAWCDRLASHGFAAVALDFYDGKTASSTQEARQLRDSANTRTPLSKALVEQSWAAIHNDHRLQATQRFLLGWSFGGAWATYSSGFLPGVTGIIAFYGESFTDNATLYDSLQAPILFVGAEQDTDPSPDTLRRIVQELTGKGKNSHLTVIPAGHGFAERNHPGYDHDATEQSWDAVKRFLDTTAS